VQIANEMLISQVGLFAQTVVTTSTICANSRCEVNCTNCKNWIAMAICSKRCHKHNLCNKPLQGELRKLWKLDRDGYLHKKLSQTHFVQIAVAKLVALAVQKVLSSSGGAGRLRLMGKYIGNRLVARPEPDYTLWTAIQIVKIGSRWLFAKYVHIGSSRGLHKSYIYIYIYIYICMCTTDFVEITTTNTCRAGRQVESGPYAPWTITSMVCSLYRGPEWVLIDQIGVGVHGSGTGSLYQYSRIALRVPTASRRLFQVEVNDAPWRVDIIYDFLS